MIRHDHLHVYGHCDISGTGASPLGNCGGASLSVFTAVEVFLLGIDPLRSGGSWDEAPNPRRTILADDVQIAD